MFIVLMAIGECQDQTHGYISELERFIEWEYCSIHKDPEGGWSGSEEGEGSWASTWRDLLTDGMLVCLDHRVQDNSVLLPVVLADITISCTAFTPSPKNSDNAHGVFGSPVSWLEKGQQWHMFQCGNVDNNCRCPYFWGLSLRSVSCRARERALHAHGAFGLGEYGGPFLLLLSLLIPARILCTWVPLSPQIQAPPTSLSQSVTLPTFGLC